MRKLICILAVVFGVSSIAGFLVALVSGATLSDAALVMSSYGFGDVGEAGMQATVARLCAVAGIVASLALLLFLLAVVVHGLSRVVMRAWSVHEGERTI